MVAFAPRRPVHLKATPEKFEQFGPRARRAAHASHTRCAAPAVGTVAMPPCQDRDFHVTDTRAVVERFVAFWSAQDVERTSSLFAEDAFSEVHFNHPEVGMAGPIHGREKITEGLYRNLAEWHYITFDAGIVAIEGDTGKVQVVFEYEHVKTHLRLSSTMRMVLVVTRGMISRVDCYHDGERIAAFMRLLRARENGMIDGDA
jgi:ketosteroid isomerase-like protein